MNEKLLSAKVKAAYPAADWQRIENGAGVGAADLNGCHGNELWLELKVTRNLKLTTLRPSQVAWHTKRWLHGGRNYILMWDEGLKGWWYLKGHEVEQAMDCQQEKVTLDVELQHPIRDLNLWLQDRFCSSQR